MSSKLLLFHFRDKEKQGLEGLSNLPKAIQISRLKLMLSGSGALLLPQPSQDIWISSFHSEHTLLTSNFPLPPGVLYSEATFFTRTWQGRRKTDWLFPASPPQISPLPSLNSFYSFKIYATDIFQFLSIFTSASVDLISSSPGCSGNILEGFHIHSPF